MTLSTAQMTDGQLLRHYCDDRSQAAFTELVNRHVHLVHAAALRRTGDPHLADDVTQAVFLVLARRAGSVRDGAILTGWLLKTTHYAAMNAMKLEFRRRFHERKAAAMASMADDSNAASISQLTATLDQALARLSIKDRSAIALRFLQGKGVSDVGRELGISTEAAQKRILRALVKLRNVLARLGIHTPIDVLDADLSQRGAHVAPAALVPLIAGNCVGHTARAAAITSIVKATARKMVAVHLKWVASGVAAGLLIAAGAAAIVSSGNAVRAAAPSTVATPPAPTTAQAAPPQAAAPATQPGVVTLPNIAFFANYNGKEFTAGIDSDMIRTPGGQPAAILTSDTPRWGDGGSSFQNVDPTPYRGKRIRFSAWVKCDGLANWGSLWLFTGDLRGRVYSNDDDCEHALTKTSDWKQFERVCDIPDGCDMIHCGLELRGKGKIWLDGATIEVVPDTIPITDDQNWHAWSFSMPHYSTRMDDGQKRNGHATRLMTSTIASSGEWLSWDHNDRHPEQFLGKKAKVSMWIKTENVTGPSGLLLDCRGPNFQSIVPGLSKDQRTIRGTTEWTRYEFTAEVPAETQNLCTGIRLGGKGKLWLDDIRCEIVK